MFLLRSLVFTNLFLIPLLFHPFNICRHLIYIGHEPFQPKLLQKNSYESHLYELLEHPRSYFHLYPLIKQENILQRIWNFFFRRKHCLSKKYFYPNLIQYTEMYLYDHDLSLFIQSFLSMYISYFLLIYFSSLVHVYRMSFRREEKSLNHIRYRAKELIESSYARWITRALFWKLIGVLISHIFYVMAVKILMQRLFITYGHFHLNQNAIYSSWNFYRNIQLIYEHDGWKSFSSGIISRMIYELGLTLLPRLIWWPFRSFFIDSTIKSYFRASSIELYFLQCLGENFLRGFFVYLHIFARMSTLEIVNQMSEDINRKNYPLLSFLRHHHHHHTEQPWSIFLPMHLIDAKLITKGLSFFFRQAN